MNRSGVLIAATCLLAGCTAASTAASAPPSPPPTAASSPTAAAPELRSVDIGGRSLTLVCAGDGSPTVILDAGMGGDHRTWENVTPAVVAQRDVRVCSYDRANVPPSDPAPAPRTLADSVADLEALLGAASEKPPFVLVGFSWGGMVTQLYASTHASDVAGLVLVESNHPDELDDFWPELTPAQLEEDKAFTRDNPELLDMEASFKEVQDAADLPEVPLVVVTAGLSEGWPEGWDPKVFDALRAGHQKDLAARVPGGVQIIADDSRHHVPSQQPQVIVDAILQVLDRQP